MKILYLITKSNWGGAQRYVYDLATAFYAKGVDVHVAFGGEGRLSEKLTESGIPWTSLPSLVRDISLTREVSAFTELYKLIKYERPDIIHLNSSKVSGLGALAARLLGVSTIVFTVHGAPFREDRVFFIKRIMYLLTWITCLLSHKVITVSKQDEADIGAMFFVRKKVETVYLGLPYEEPKVRMTPKSREARIITVGDLTKNKGHLYALHAIQILKERGLDVSYHIIGEGEERVRIEEFVAHKKLENHVHLHGYQYAQDIIHDYDVYLLSSVKEGLPYILLEAGKASLPVVATITGGVPEIVRHEETGLLVQQKNVTGLANALERLIRDRKLAKSLGQALHAHIVQNFSYSKMLVETAKVYGLIESKK